MWLDDSQEKKQVVKTDWKVLPEGHIRDIQTRYKYLGIWSHGNHDKEARKTTTSKYHKRISQILKSQVNGKNSIHAIKIYALPVVRHPASIVSWPKNDMESANLKTWELVSEHRDFHSRS